MQSYFVGISDGLAISLYEYLLSEFNLADRNLDNMVTMMNYLENYIRIGGFSKL